MSITEAGSELAQRVHELVRIGFTPHFGAARGQFGSRPLWKRLRELGTELWLDTGDADAVAEIWTREFGALTTNNTLLNKEVQKGTYDGLIAEASDLLHGYPLLGEHDRRLELAFVLNARHALRLVEQFDAYVSVEEHTALVDDVEGTINYARRFHAICPERFIVKVPFSAAGLLATRRLSDEGIPVNHTLGFSARQNYLISRIGRPVFVNVFLGRLNSFVADNGLGDGTYVGERAALASQGAVRRLREERDLAVRQIGASLRSPEQVRDLAGMDVLTMPPAVAKEALARGATGEALTDATGRGYEPGVDPDAAASVGLKALWDLDDRAVSCVDALDQERPDMFTPVRLRGFFERHGCRDLLAKWSEKQVRTSAEEGKIPRLENWHDALAGGRVGLDSLMSLAGWNSFRADQQEMDRHVDEVLASAL